MKLGSWIRDGLQVSPVKFTWLIRTFLISLTMDSPL